MNRTTLSAAALLSASFAVSLAPAVQACDEAKNPFVASDLAATLVAEHHEGEGKCGAKDGEEHEDGEHHEGDDHDHGDEKPQ